MPAPSAAHHQGSRRWRASPAPVRGCRRARGARRDARATITQTSTAATGTPRDPALDEALEPPVVDDAAARLAGPRRARHQAAGLLEPGALRATSRASSAESGLVVVDPLLQRPELSRQLRSRRGRDQESAARAREREDSRRDPNPMRARRLSPTSSPRACTPSDGRDRRARRSRAGEPAERRSRRRSRRPRRPDRADARAMARDGREHERNAREQEEPAERVRRDERRRRAPRSEERASLFGVRQRVRDLLGDAHDFGAQVERLREAEEAEGDRGGRPAALRTGAGPPGRGRARGSRSRRSTPPRRRSRA